MNDPPSRLQIHLLGPVEILVDGAPLRVDTRKAAALLAYLAVSDRRQSRDHLADLLWPSSSPDRARATLRRTLSTLRSALGERWVDADRTWVRFHPDGDVALDIDGFLADAGQTHDHGLDAVCSRCVESLQHAADRYRGPFMEGFGVRGCPDFDDWMLGEAEHLRRRASTVLDRLSTALSREGRYADAIDATRRWLELDPLHERAHRMSMLLHAWSGDRSGAVDAYRACVAILDRELGVEPLEETVELYEAILEEDLPRAPAPGPPPPAAVAARPHPFVGREGVLARLHAVVDAGRGLIVLEGELGVGKTRLLDELAAGIDGSRAAMVVGRAHRTESGVAYGPVQAALSEAARRPLLAERLHSLPPTVAGQAARLVPTIGVPAPGDPADPTAKARFLDGIARTIGALGDTTVLAIDNLHWTDSATIELVAHLARRLEELGVVLILTRRPEDTPMDHPVAILVDELSVDAEIIRLERLTLEAVTELVGAVGVDGLDPRHVFERTRGLPFFVVEYLEAARAGRTELPAAIRRLLLGRLSGLDAIGRQIVTALSVIGTATDVDSVRVVSGRSEGEVTVGLDELIRRSMLRELDDGDIDFIHEQLREIAYDEATMARRRLLHRRAAAHLSSAAGATTDPHIVAAAARHHMAAGEDAQAAELSVTAGDLAAGLFAAVDALGHYETALALGHPERGALHFRIGELRTRTGAYGAALVSFEAAHRAHSEAGRIEEAARTAHAVGEVHRRLRRWELASAAYDEAWQDAEEDLELRARVAADWAFVQHRMGEDDRARDLARTARELAAASGSAEALAHALSLSGLLEESEQRIRYLERALEVAGEPASRIAVLNNLALARAGAGDVEGAIRLGRSALELATRSGDVHRMAALHDSLADFLHRAGDEEAAMAELKEAVSLFADIGMEPGALEPEVWLLKEW